MNAVIQMSDKCWFTGNYKQLTVQQLVEQYPHVVRNYTNKYLFSAEVVNRMNSVLDLMR